MAAWLLVVFVSTIGVTGLEFSLDRLFNRCPALQPLSTTELTHAFVDVAIRVPRLSLLANLGMKTPSCTPRGLIGQPFALDIVPPILSGKSLEARFWTENGVDFVHKATRDKPLVLFFMGPAGVGKTVSLLLIYIDIDAAHSTSRL